MALTDEEEAAGEPGHHDFPADHAAHDDHAHHPPDRAYIGIAIILAVLTAIEVALYYFPPGEAEVPLLLILMVLKFIIVAAYFMHLKLDNKLLTQVFTVGLVLAVLVYVAVLFSFEFWT